MYQLATIVFRPHNNIVVKTHKRDNLIRRAFVSQDIAVLVRAYLVYDRRLVLNISQSFGHLTVYTTLKMLNECRDASQNIFLDYVNSVIRKDYVAWVCPVCSIGVYLVIWCGVTKYYLVLLGCQQRIFLSLVGLHALQLEAINTNCLSHTTSHV